MEISVAGSRGLFWYIRGVWLEIFIWGRIGMRDWSQRLRLGGLMLWRVEGWKSVF
jgi:hypothetical protein